MISEFFSASEVLGVLYYWSIGVQGVMRVHISVLSAMFFFFDLELGDCECVFCYIVLCDGCCLVVVYGGECFCEVMILECEVRIFVDLIEDGFVYGWGMFNFGVIWFFYVNCGALMFLDVEMGVVLCEVEFFCRYLCYLF